MKCPNCGKQTSKTRTRYIDGEMITRCHVCGDFSELGGYPEHLSPLVGKRIQGQREKMAKDIMQPWEVKKGETWKGYQPNKDFIKAYRSDPDKLSIYTEKELKDSGLVTKKQAKQAKSKDGKRAVASVAE